MNLYPYLFAYLQVGNIKERKGSKFGICPGYVRDGIIPNFLCPFVKSRPKILYLKMCVFMFCNGTAGVSLDRELRCSRVAYPGDAQ